MPGGIDLDVPESATSKTSESIIFNLIEKRTKLFDTCSGDRIKSTFFFASSRVSFYAVDLSASWNYEA